MHRFFRVLLGTVLLVGVAAGAAVDDERGGGASGERSEHKSALTPKSGP